jgi:uncharacterized membrane protein HdeD (DUF308 family)
MSTPTLTQEVKKRSGWSIVIGVLIAILGLFLIAYPLVAATITTIVLGWTLIFVGTSQFVFALYSRTPGNFLLKVLAGLLYGFTGAGLVFSPLAGVSALTMLLGSLLLVQAVVAAITAFQIRPLAGWGSFLLDSASNLLMGLLILVKWPSSSVWAIGTLVGISVLMGGISRILVASKIRSGASVVDRVIHKAA